MNSLNTSIKQRIENNYQDDLSKLYDYKIVYEIDGIIIKVKLNRAVLENATEFRNMMNSILTIEYKHYILDFSSVLFMDSTFLGSIVMSLKKISSLNRNLSIILDYDKIKILAPFRDLKKLLQIYSSPEEAISELKKH